MSLSIIRIRGEGDDEQLPKKKDALKRPMRWRSSPSGSTKAPSGQPSRESRPAGRKAQFRLGETMEPTGDPAPTARLRTTG